MNRIKVMVVDDYVTAKEGLKKIFEMEDEVGIVFLPKIEKYNKMITALDRYIEKPNENKERAHLTKKEKMVLEKVVKGRTSKAIAIDMNITERTVKAHLTNIYKKLQVSSRAEAITMAIINKFVSV